MVIAFVLITGSAAAASLNVVVSTDKDSYKTGETVYITANVTNGTLDPVPSGTVTADITADGNPIDTATGISLVYNATTQFWEGNHTLLATEPSGAWDITVNADDGQGNTGSSDIGINTLLYISRGVLHYQTPPSMSMAM